MHKSSHFTYQCSACVKCEGRDKSSIDSNLTTVLILQLVIGLIHSYNHTHMYCVIA